MDQTGRTTPENTFLKMKIGVSKMLTGHLPHPHCPPATACRGSHFEGAAEGQQPLCFSERRDKKATRRPLRLRAKAGETSSANEGRKTRRRVRTETGSQNRKIINCRGGDGDVGTMWLPRRERARVWSRCRLRRRVGERGDRGGGETKSRGCVQRFWAPGQTCQSSSPESSA